MENERLDDLLKSLKSDEILSISGSLLSIQNHPTGDIKVRHQLESMLADRRLCIVQQERPTLVAEIGYAAGEALACERALAKIDEDVVVAQTFKPIDATQVFNVLTLTNNSTLFYQVAQELLEEKEEKGTLNRFDFTISPKKYHYYVWRQNATPAERVREDSYKLLILQSQWVSDRSEKLKQIEQVYNEIKDKKMQEDLTFFEEKQLAKAEIALIGYGQLQVVENILDDFLIPFATDYQAQSALPGKRSHITSCKSALAELLPLPDEFLEIGFSYRFVTASPVAIKEWFHENSSKLTFDELEGKYVFV